MSRAPPAEYGSADHSADQPLSSSAWDPANPYEPWSPLPSMVAPGDVHRHSDSIPQYNFQGFNTPSLSMVLHQLQLQLLSNPISHRTKQCMATNDILMQCTMNSSHRWGIHPLNHHHFQYIRSILWSIFNIQPIIMGIISRAITLTLPISIFNRFPSRNSVHNRSKRHNQFRTPTTFSSKKWLPLKPQMPASKIRWRPLPQNLAPLPPIVSRASKKAPQKTCTLRMHRLSCLHPLSLPSCSKLAEH